MIRLPVTAISLKPRDIKDFERRNKRRKDLLVENVNNDFSRFAVGSSEGPTFEQKRHDTRSRDLLQQSTELPDKQTEEPEPYLRALVPYPANLSQLNPEETIIVDTSGLEEYDESSDDQDGFVDISLQEGQRSLTPPRDSFHYGGFLENPRSMNERAVEERAASKSPVSVTDQSMADASSPFVPDDVSSPPNFDPRRLRHRFPPPRSPLYLSQNVSSSPEHQFTTGLTPRVVSRVATGNSPGMIFAAPARRLPKKLRHQANSFSFDSSERASAAYDQERVVSGSSLFEQRQADDVSLHDELRGSSLQSSREPSGASYSLPGRADQHANPNSRVDSSSVPKGPIRPSNEYTGENDDYEERSFIFSSPQLPLPPPFSAVSRNVSGADSLPSSTLDDHMAANPMTSPARSLSSSPSRSLQDEREESERSSPNISQQYRDIEPSPPSGSGMSPRSFAQRILSTVRIRSPLSRRRTSDGLATSAMEISDQAQPSPPGRSLTNSSLSNQTPEQDQRAQAGNLPPQTPSRSYQVYNDSMSPRTQPQTPANLPESRHQSRYHSAYTAPVTRSRRTWRPVEATDNTDGANDERPARILRSSLRHRPHSPAGLGAQGFQGLYGGRENGDDEQNWFDGVRFNSAEIVLFPSTGAQDDRASLRETPEREDAWRGGRFVRRLNGSDQVE